MTCSTQQPNTYSTRQHGHKSTYQNVTGIFYGIFLINSVKHSLVLKPLLSVAFNRKDRRFQRIRDQLTQTFRIQNLPLPYMIFLISVFRLAPPKLARLTFSFSFNFILSEIINKNNEIQELTFTQFKFFKNQYCLPNIIYQKGSNVVGYSGYPTCLDPLGTTIFTTS